MATTVKGFCDKEQLRALEFIRFLGLEYVGLDIECQVKLCEGKEGFRCSKDGNVTENVRLLKKRVQKMRNLNELRDIKLGYNDFMRRFNKLMSEYLRGLSRGASFEIQMIYIDEKPKYLNGVNDSSMIKRIIQCR